jgi:hypothetical protein
MTRDLALLLLLLLLLFQHLQLLLLCLYRQQKMHLQLSCTAGPPLLSFAQLLLLLLLLLLFPYCQLQHWYCVVAPSCPVSRSYQKPLSQAQQQQQQFSQVRLSWVQLACPLHLG